MRRICTRAGALAAALAVLVGAVAGTAGAATLKASYLLQGTRASQTAGAPELVDLGPGNRFATETIDGVPRQVLAFPRGGGLSLATEGLVSPISHSIVMNVRLDDVFGFRRLLDFSGGDSDAGLYDLDGRLVLYEAGGLGGNQEPTLDGSWVQVALTSEATITGSQWTVVAVNGSPVQGVATSRRFRLGAAGLRLFKDNVRGPSRGEESAGAVACILLYDGSLTLPDLRQVAAGPLCPAPRPLSPAQLGFAPGTYLGRTSQGLPIGLQVGATSVQYIAVRWRARCSDGRVRTRWGVLHGSRLRQRRFTASDRTPADGRGRVAGTITGHRASGTLSRRERIRAGTTCVARGVRWHARLRRIGGS